MKYGAGSDFAREVFARSSSACMVDSKTPSPFSAGGALHARIPLAARTANNVTGIESRSRLMGVLNVEPPAFDRCRLARSRTAGFSPVPNQQIMPGFDLLGKRFSIVVILRDRTLTCGCTRN